MTSKNERDAAFQPFAEVEISPSAVAETVFNETARIIRADQDSGEDPGRNPRYILRAAWLEIFVASLDAGGRRMLEAALFKSWEDHGDNMLDRLAFMTERAMGPELAKMVLAQIDAEDTQLPS